MTNQIITLKLTEEQIQKLGDTFALNKTSKVPPYAYYQLKCEDCVITAYTSGKVVFQGKDAEIYSSSFQKKKAIHFLYLFEEVLPKAR